jgi:hypothetical protein
MWLPHVGRGSLAAKKNGSALRQITGPRILTPVGKAARGYANPVQCDGTGQCLSDGYTPSPSSYGS